MLMTSDNHYFIEPLKGHAISPDKPHPHIIYKALTTDTTTTNSANRRKEDNPFCTSHKGTVHLPLFMISLFKALCNVRFFAKVIVMLYLAFSVNLQRNNFLTG